jgi:hypothetical protein
MEVVVLIKKLNETLAHSIYKPLPLHSGWCSHSHECHNFGTHWITTDELPTGYLYSFDKVIRKILFNDSGAKFRSYTGTDNRLIE